MEIVVDLLIVLVVLQTALRMSLWPKWWMRLLFVAVVAIALCLSVGRASAMSKPMLEGWLHDTAFLQDVAVMCLLDALLLRFRWYPGLLILPASFYVLCQLLFSASGMGFQTTAVLLAACLVLFLLLSSAGLTKLLPTPIDSSPTSHKLQVSTSAGLVPRKILLILVSCLLCIISLVATQTASAIPLSSTINHQPSTLFMEYITKVLFGIANILLIPDIILLIFFFIRSLVLLATTYMQYSSRRSEGHSPLYLKYRTMLYGHDADEAYADYLAAQLEAEAAKDVNLSRLLTKVGPVLGLIGTLVSMSPALVGLSNGDISGMAYNMQVVFSSTVVGLVISIVGLFTQQLKSRWYQQDVSRLEYVSHQYIEHHEKEA